MVDSTTPQDDVTRLTIDDDKEVILVGTAHISQQSVDIVRDIIAQEQPDVVCVELDDERFKAMTQQQNWEDLDLRQVIRNKQLGFLMARLALSAFQKRMGSYTGVKPGAEMAAAIEAADAIGAKVVLCDRNVRTTLLRAWRKTPWWKRAGLGGMIFFGLFERTEINEDELAKLRQTHNISTILDEMGEVLPSVKGVLVDERDTFMAHQIQQAQGKKVLVVIGAAHKPGITRQLPEGIRHETIEAINHVPAPSMLSRVLPWLIPAIVVGMFAYGFSRGNLDGVREAAVAWVLANGLLSALGALIALGHPLTILAAFIAAPITSLNPTVGAGMVTAFVQVWMSPPQVRDMERVGDDIMIWQGWWRNKLARVFLVFILSSIGSSIGTFVAFGFFKNLLS